MLNIFEFSWVWENEEFWLFCVNKLFRIAQIASASFFFLAFETFNDKKKSIL